MRFTTRLGAVLKMAAAAALGLAALGQPGPAAAQGLPGGTWGLAQAVNLSALPPAGSRLPAGSNGAIEDVSCVSPGNCAAIGSYDSTVIATGVTTGYPFVLNETDGTWGTPATVAGISGAPIPAQTGEAVSCAAPGECAAEWTGGGHAYLIDESGGAWGQAQPVTIGTESPGLSGVSCPAVGDCTAIGGYVPSSGGGNIPFVMDSSAGTWGAPQEIAGVAALSAPSPTGATLTSVSCTSGGNCVAGGTYNISSADGRPHPQPFLAIETGGSWGPAESVAGAAALTPAAVATLSSVSCGAPGDCTAMGLYSDQTGLNTAGTWVAAESGGSWGPAQQLPVPASSRTLGEALSCSPQGFCVVAGTYVPASGGAGKAFTATHSGGAWTAQDVPGLAAAKASDATAVSCGAPGYCTVGGYYYPAGSGTPLLFLADDVNGAWANAQDVPGAPGGAGWFIDPSCTTAGYCTAIGLAGTTAFTVSEATASAVALQVSAPVVSYGDEEAETVTATVTSPAGGTPTGTVTVSSGSAAVCTITLAGGTGSCALAATQFPPGTTPQLTAIYNGSTDFEVSQSTAAAALTVTSPPGGFTPDGPVRILDTRHNIGGYNTPVGANKTITLQVTGQNGVPAGATAVVLNVTAVNPTAASSYVTVYPDGQPRPVASNLNFTKGQTIAGQVTVPVGADGAIALYNYNGTVDLVADLAGYYTTSGGSGYTPARPVRILDTRSPGYSPILSGQTIYVQVTGRNGVPSAGVTAVVLNITAVNPTANSYLTVFPGGQALPVASNLNFVKGQTIANLVTVPVDATGEIALYNYNGTVNLVADLAGYYSASGSSGFNPAGPVRILDTRHNTGGHDTPVGANQSITLQITGQNGVPASGVSAVVLNVTAVNPTAGSSYITVYPDGQPLPVASNLNFAKGQTLANLVVVPVGADGKIDLYNYNGTVDLIADLAGYYAN